MDGTVTDVATFAVVLAALVLGGKVRVGRHNGRYNSRATLSLNPEQTFAAGGRDVARAAGGRDCGGSVARTGGGRVPAISGSYCPGKDEAREGLESAE